MRCYSKKLILLLLLIVVSLLVGCTFVDNFVGQAGRMTDNGKGTWLVVTLDQVKSDVFRVSKLDTQQFDKEQEEFFKRFLSRISPEDRGFTHQLIIRQGRDVYKEYFSSKTVRIIEDFSGEGISLEGSVVEDKKIIVVKVADLNLRKRFEISVKKLKDQRRKVILSERQSYNFLKKLRSKKKVIKPRVRRLGSKDLGSRNRITGKTISQLDVNTCENLNEVIPGHNDANDQNRINIVFLGYGYPEKDIFVDSLPYYLDLDGEGFTTEVEWCEKWKSEPSIIWPDESELDFEGSSKKSVFNLFEENPLKKNCKKIVKKTHTYPGLFYFVPFNENKDKFNFWYYDEIVEYEMKETYGYCKCMPDSVRSTLQANCQLSNPKISVMCYDRCRSNANLDGFKSENSIFTVPFYGADSRILSEKEFGVDFSKLKFGTRSINVFVHEFGHLFGDLKDEYNEENKSDIKGFPNCASGLDQLKEWWENSPVVDDFSSAVLQQPYGCAYSASNKNLYFTLMNNPTLWSIPPSKDFGNVNKAYLCYKIFQASGSVSGDSCDSLFSFSPPVEICGNDLDDDKDGLTDCTDSDCCSTDVCSSSDGCKDPDNDGVLTMDDNCPLKSNTDQRLDSDTLLFYDGFNKGEVFIMVKEVILGNFYSDSIKAWSNPVDDAHKESPSSWNLVNGVMRQSSNIHNLPNDDSNYLGTYYYASGLLTKMIEENLMFGYNLDDYHFYVKVRASDDDVMGVMFRYHYKGTTPEYYRLRWNKEKRCTWAWGSSTGSFSWPCFSKKAGLILEKKVGKNFKVLGFVDGAYNTGQWYDLRVELKGPKIKIFVDHDKKLEVLDNDFDKGTVALYTWGNPNTDFDEVRITQNYDPDCEEIEPVAPVLPIEPVAPVEPVIPVEPEAPPPGPSPRPRFR